MRSDHPSGARGWFDLEGFGGRMDRCMFEMLEAIRSGGPVWERLYGSGMWEDLDEKPALAESFNHLMAIRSTVLYPHVIEAYSWSHLGRVIDVGGGTGVLLSALATEYRGLEGEVVDLPAAVEGARRRFAESGLEGRLSARAGNFFEPLPGGADAYLLSSIIHDRNDEKATRILQRCAEAAGRKGRILIIDAVLGENSAQSAVTAMDLRMLLLLGGRERSLADYENLAHRAGLRIAEVKSIPMWGGAIIDCRLAE